MPNLAPLSTLRILSCNMCRINDAFGWEMDADFDKTGLQDALDYLCNRMSITYRFDEEALADRLNDLRSTPVIYVANRILLPEIIEQILTPLELGYRIEDEILVITTRAEADRTHAGIDSLRQKLPNLVDVNVGW